MSERSKLKEIQGLITRGKHAEARKIVEGIHTTDPALRLDVIMILLVVYNHVTENDQLLKVTDEGIGIATLLGKSDIKTYLVARKAIFLTSKLSTLVAREKNLVLSSNVFGWIAFSLERDKLEYESIIEKRKEIEGEVNALIAEVIEKTEASNNHYLRGSTFSAIGDFFSSMYFMYLLDFQKGGRLKSKIANMYFVRRWNLILLLYDRVNRKKILQSREKCFEYFEYSIQEFRLSGNQSEEVHAMYNLAVKFMMTNHFRNAKRLLNEARPIAETLGESHLLVQIDALKEEITNNKNRYIRDYVREMGLDLP